MDSVFESYLGPEGVLTNAVVSAMTGATVEPDDIPKVNTTVWILGKSYNAIQELELVRRDVQSRLWCTYRRGFVPLGLQQFTTDKGWGCMLRCGQMVLAQALIDLHLGRDWFWTAETRDSTYLKIVNRFEDSRKSFFSLHQIALMGDSLDKTVGQWMGPNTVAQVLKKLVCYDDWCSLMIHVAMDNTIVVDDIITLCLTNPKNDESWKPLLLILPLRLGVTDINPIYIPSLKKCFELVGNCGIIGGRPNQALYFLGYVDDDVLFLDPHTTQRSGTVGQKTTKNESEFDETFHQKYAGRLKFIDMDPSLAVCFLCKSRMSFDILLENLKNQVLPASTQPLFEITKSRSQEWVPSMTGIIPSNISLELITDMDTDLDTTGNYLRSYDEVTNDLEASYVNYTSISSDGLLSYNTSTISGGDTDLENIDQSSLEPKRGNCCDANESSDDDFEIIS